MLTLSVVPLCWSFLALGGYRIPSQVAAQRPQKSPPTRVNRVADHSATTVQNNRDLSTDYFLPEEENEESVQTPGGITIDIVSTFSFSKEVTSRPLDAEIESLLRNTENFYRRLFGSLYSQSYSSTEIQGNGSTWTSSSIMVKYRLTVSFFAGSAYYDYARSSTYAPNLQQILSDIANFDRASYLNNFVKRVTPATNFAFANSVIISSELAPTPPLPTPPPMMLTLPPVMPTNSPSLSPSSHPSSKLPFDPDLEVCHDEVISASSDHLDHIANIHVANVDGITQNATFMDGTKPLFDEIKRTHREQGGDHNEVDHRAIIALMMSRDANATGAPANLEYFDVNALLRAPPGVYMRVYNSAPSSEDMIAYNSNFMAQSNSGGERKLDVIGVERKLFVVDDIEAVAACIEAIIDVGSSAMAFGACLVAGITDSAVEKAIKEAAKALIKREKQAKKDVAELWLDPSNTDGTTSKIYQTFKIFVEAIGGSSFFDAIMAQLSWWDKMIAGAKFLVNIALAIGTGGASFVVRLALKVEKAVDLAEAVEEVISSCGA